MNAFSAIILYWSIAVCLITLRITNKSFQRLVAYSKSKYILEESVFEEFLVSLQVSRCCAFRFFYATGVSVTFTLLVLNTWFRTCEISRISALHAHLFHVIRRLFESFYVHKFSQSYISIAACAAGTSFYIMVPITYAYVLERQHSVESYASGISLSIFGLFLLISCIQVHFHVQLSRLRAQKFDDAFSIPPFEFVLFPHYTAEIALYAIVCLYSKEPIDFLLFSMPALFTVMNLGVTSAEQRLFYTRNFPLSQAPKYNIFPLVY